MCSVTYSNELTEVELRITSNATRVFLEIHGSSVISLGFLVAMDTIVCEVQLLANNNDGQFFSE